MNWEKKIILLKNTGTFQEQTENPLELSKQETSCRQEIKKVELFLHVSVYAKKTTI